MAITAFTSTAIIDATTIGKTVLTASSAGIAADAIGLGTTDDVTFNSVGCVDGSFSGNLINEVGGSYKLYNLGADGDTDTEYLEISATANEYFISPKVTGAGARRDLFVTGHWGAARSHIEFQENGNLKIAYGSNANMLVGSSYVKFRANSTPNGDNAYSSGSSSERWSAVHAVDVQASTMTLSNLPTSDPAVAGQLWNDSGTVKISSG